LPTKTRFLAAGILHKGKWAATAEISFKIDLSNESDLSSAEIEPAYLYFGKEWTVIQDQRECSSTDSDLHPFKKRYFLTLPVRRLHKNAWAQLNFHAKRVLARAYEGEELKDSSGIAGRPSSQPPLGWR
jgi:hypothetical protein